MKRSLENTDDLVRIVEYIPMNREEYSRRIRSQAPFEERFLQLAHQQGMSLIFSSLLCCAVIAFSPPCGSCHIFLPIFDFTPFSVIISVSLGFRSRGGDSGFHDHHVDSQAAAFRGRGNLE